MKTTMRISEMRYYRMRSLLGYVRKPDYVLLLQGYKETRNYCVIQNIVLYNTDVGEEQAGFVLASNCANIRTGRLAK
jgi:hypothetical protein